MKIEQSKFEEFLDKIQMSGSQIITECILDFEETGVKMVATSPAKQSRISAYLKASAFKEYEAIGKICIDNLPEFYKVVKRFNDIIILKHEGNLLTVKGKKEVDVSLADISFFSTETNEPDLKFVDTFTLPINTLKEIVGDITLNKDSKVCFETDVKKVKISNTGKYKFRHALDAITCQGGAKSTFGEPFIDAIAKLTNDLEVSIAVNYPVKIMEKTADSIITIIVAPIVDEE